jgi:transposase
MPPPMATATMPPLPIPSGASPEEEIARLRAENAQLRKQNQEIEQQARLEQAKLRAEVEQLKRRLYGPKSEKLDPAQASLAFDAAFADLQIAVQEPLVHVAPAQTAKVSRPRRLRQLPIKVTIIDLPEEEKRGLVKIREEITDKIECKPAELYLNRIIRYVYADPLKLQAPKIAALPPQVLPQSSLGTTLIVDALIKKYVDHLPLYRQSKMAERDGIVLEPQKLARGVEAAAHLLVTIRDQLAEKIRAGRYIQADETPVNVMDDERPGRVRPAWLWAYHSPPGRAVVFDFHRSRGRDSPASFIPPNWTGVLQTDGWETYASLLRERVNIDHVACWAHARRYVHEALQSGDKSEEVINILADISRLYRVEEEARGYTPEARARLRDTRSRIVLGRLHQRLSHQSAVALPKSAIGKAAAYALNRWTELTRYAEPGNGHVEIDNNPVERNIRPTALGRKNWLFIGHPDAGWIAGTIYTVTGTCKLLGVNPAAYLNWVLPQLAGATNQSVSGLLPHDYAAVVKELEA